MTKFTNRQKQIIQASLELIANSGIHGLTIKNISKKVGISEPAIYRHFDCKTDILIGVIATMKESSNTELSLPRDKSYTAIQIIRNAFIVRAQRFTINPSVAAVIFSESIFENDSKMSESIGSMMKESQIKLITLIEKRQNEGEIDKSIDAEDLTLMIIGAFRLLVTKWHMSKNSFDLEEKTNNLFNTLEQLI